MTQRKNAPRPLVQTSAQPPFYGAHVTALGVAVLIVLACLP